MNRKLWEKNIEKLKIYYKEHGNFKVPSDWNKDVSFSRWVENIRQLSTPLSLKERDQLDKIGFRFKLRSDWNTMFFKLEEFYKRHGHSYISFSDKGLEDLLDWTIDQKRGRSRLTAKQIKALDSLNFDWDIFSGKDTKWQLRYEELIEFKRKHGHIQVPEGHIETRSLAAWVSRQRRKETKKELSAEKIKLLNKLGLLWAKDIIKKREQAWEKRYNELVRYKRTYGHIDRIKIRRDHYQLGLWVETQLVRQRHLSPYRKRKLNAITFKWDKGKVHEERWNDMYEKLMVYAKKNGHCGVKRSDDFKLSIWLRRQKRDKDKLPPEKRKKLQQLGIKWSGEYFREVWELKYQQLKEFKKRKGHFSVGRSNPELFEWVQFQKRLKAEKKLSKERIEKLNSIGFIWKGEIQEQKMTLWESMYKRFKAFKEKYGSRYILLLNEHPELDEWVNLQLHSKEKLSAIKKEKLNAIHFPWKRRECLRHEHWEEKYRQLLAYKKQFGHCDVPQKYPVNRPLAQWVNAQRLTKLSPDKKNKLNKIGFSWSGEIKQKQWRQKVDEFVKLKQKNKLDAIRAHTPLHSWIYQQKKNFNKLSRDKKKILVETGICTMSSSLKHIE